MAQYTKRTCNKCGIRDIQPNMVQRQIQVKTGKSKKSATGATLMGSMLDNKRSTNALSDAIFNNNQRNYYRNRTVWMCKRCANAAQKEAKSQENAAIWVVGIIVVIIVALFSGGA